MKLKEQVVNLDPSKQLKEAGYPQEGLWWWCKNGEHKWDLEIGKHPHSECYVAPTVAELGKGLPHNYPSMRNNYQGECVCYDYERKCQDQFADTEANARAKMWLYLKKKENVK